MFLLVCKVFGFFYAFSILTIMLVHQILIYITVEIIFIWLVDMNILVFTLQSLI